MIIYVDADACPVITIIEQCAKQHQVPVVLICDTNHILSSDYSEVITIGAGMDAVDLALINRCKRGDVVVTQDTGVAALALGKGAYPIHPKGKWYTNDNINLMLMERHIAKEERKKSSKHHLKGPKKRTPEDDLKFFESFISLIQFIKDENIVG